jgi:two-component system sensor histidine kinase KdpD
VSIERRRSGWLLAVVLLPGLTASLLPLRDRVDLASDMLGFLLVTVVVALVGGPRPALATAATASLLLNYFFTPPLHTWVISDPGNLSSLLVFLLVAALVSGAVDVAARRTQQAADAAARAELHAAAARLRTALLASVGHDLRSPLAIAKAGVSGVRSQADLTPQDRADLLASADHALDRLAGLMDNLLDLSRVQTGALAVRRVPVAVGDVVTAALEDLGVAPRAVLLDVPDDVPPVLADAGLLERVLANVVGNAQKHAAGPIPPTVVVRQDGELLRIKVADRGPGIAEVDRERVFQPFQRLEDTSTEGLGLGLALARGLTEAMGGSVHLEGSALGGTTVVITLDAATGGAP